MKKILGLDLGTTSIGWAFVNEAERNAEKSSIIKTGVRVVPLSTDEKSDFKKGKSITVNADRTLKRGARRNLYRYKLRREALIQVLTELGFIRRNTILAEDGRHSTFSTYRLRAKAVTEQIGKEELARVLLMINKKRGYKSGRKANKLEEGEIIDGMDVAQNLAQNKLTPGQYSYGILKDGKKNLPDFYRSDLLKEFFNIWNFQKPFYSEILTRENFELFQQKDYKKTRDHFEKKLGIERVELKGSRTDKKLETLRLRSEGLNQRLDLSEIAHVLTELRKEVDSSSGYLGEISDRSKELYFNKQTIGQYQFRLLKENNQQSLKNQVFYRQDYMNEFDAIWKEQSKHYLELTDELKDRIKNQIIFYQRRLKSQKGLISYCEFESWDQELLKDGKKHRKTIGHRVIPKSSLLFQEFKIWHNINSIRITNKEGGEEFLLDEEMKELLFQELNWKDKLTAKEAIKFIGCEPKNWKLNFEHLEGNRTNAKLLSAYQQILETEGYDIDFKKLKAWEKLEALHKCFSVAGINTDILHFKADLQGNTFDKQPSYSLWHLLYSYEEDDSTTGTSALLNKLNQKYGFNEEQSRILSSISFEDDYGNLSARAIRKIFPHLRDGLEYPEACKLAGYNHSSSLTRTENEERTLEAKLDLLKKNSLRNPVVEKILNQMINLVNTILEKENLGRPDEIRVEMSRELKKTAQQRAEMTKEISRVTKEHERYREIIIREFGLSYVSRNDLIRYKLYRELKSNGYKTIYSNTYIEPKDLFTNKFDIEHIIPKARIFDDSFSNKTLETRNDNIWKGDETALDYVSRKYGQQAAEDYKQRVEDLFEDKAISFTKRKKLLMRVEDIPENFLARDLGVSAYIARKSAEILLNVTRKVTLTSGSITSQLRDDWGLVKVLQELNWNKYDKVGLTYYDTNKNGKELRRIKDWSKRNDHRHHAMDAITVAFTRPAHIQYLNNLNARSKNGKKTSDILLIEKKYTYRDEKGKRKFTAPFPEIRSSVKQHLDSLLVSHKTKNKVTTNNKNRIKSSGKNSFVVKTEQTPRGQLHKGTVYGKSRRYVTKVEKIDGSFVVDKINSVANKKYRDALLMRLEMFENDPKLAFTGKNSLIENPVFLNGTQESLPDRIKLVYLKDQYTIRKKIDGDLKLDKVIDGGIRTKLKARLEEYNGKSKEAFSNLDENPIWLNEDKKIPIKRVKITGVSNALPLHFKRDHLGDFIQIEGESQPANYVSTGNNHHVAIFMDQKGNLQEEVVSFFEAVVRVNLGESIVQREHSKDWKFLFTMKQNEMFVFPSEDFSPNEIDLLDPKLKNLVSRNLFRVQKISTKNYLFAHHLETEAISGETLKNKKELSGITYQFLQSANHLSGIVKVRINHLGDIVGIGEY